MVFFCLFARKITQSDGRILQKLSGNIDNDNDADGDVSDSRGTFTLNVCNVTYNYCLYIINCS